MPFGETLRQLACGTSVDTLTPSISSDPTWKPSDRATQPPEPIPEPQSLNPKSRKSELELDITMKLEKVA